VDRKKGADGPSRSKHTGLQAPKEAAEPAVSPCTACPVRPLAICSGLSPGQLPELEKIVTHLVVKAGQTIFLEGEAANYRYNLTRGCVRIFKLLGDGRRQIVGFLFPGDFLGLAIEDDYAYGAEAVTETHLCRFPRRDLDNLISRFPAMERRLIEVASHELAIAQDQMVLLGRKRAEEKVVTMLLALSKRGERRGESGNPVHLPMTRNDLGGYLGLTMETVSRTMTELKTSGLIREERGHNVRLLDIDKLEEIAEGF
jgi:CRP/FNR family transcriptional regulator